tara:strand:- start:219 stop:818 length:600 start_codon:yes stop_codon:yes gene_type:complete
MATKQTDIQNAIHTLLTATRTAKETRAELVADHIEPQDETISGSMFLAVVTGYDLTEGQWDEVRKFLKDKGHSQGAINQIARFMAGNKGHENLAGELKGCTDKTVEGRIKYLQGDKKFVSYKKLYQACCPPSDEAVINKIAKQLAALEASLYVSCLDKADKLRMEEETEETETAHNVEAGKRHKMVTKKAVAEAMAVSS